MTWTVELLGQKLERLGVLSAEMKFFHEYALLSYADGVFLQDGTLHTVGIVFYSTLLFKCTPTEVGLPLLCPAKPGRAVSLNNCKFAWSLFPVAYKHHFQPPINGGNGGGAGGGGGGGVDGGATTGNGGAGLAHNIVNVVINKRCYYCGKVQHCFCPKTWSPA